MLDGVSVTKPSGMYTNAPINITTVMSSWMPLKSPMSMPNLADAINSEATTAATTAIISSFSNVSTPVLNFQSVNATISTVATTLMTTTSTGVLVNAPDHDSASTFISLQVNGMSCVWKIVLYASISVFAYQCV